MLPRTLLLLLVCVSVGMCATLGHYQAQAQEEEEEALAVTESPAADTDVAAPADVQADDPPAAEEPGDDSLVGDILSTETPVQDIQEADKPEVDAPEVDAPEVDAPEADAPEAAAPEAAAPEADAPEADAPVADAPTAGDPETESDGPAGDAPVEEALTEEAVTQEQPASDAAVSHEQPSSDEATTPEEPFAEAVHQVKPSDEEEEDNEIKVSVNTQVAPEESSSWGFNSIRNSFQTMNGYFDSLVELVGGQDGVCQYRCRYGEAPQPRPGYQLPEPNGCSSSLVGFQLDLGIPAMTSCCDELDLCYDTCGMSKYECDTRFRTCLHGICTDVNKSLGFVKKVEACESMADTLFNTVWTLGCRPYMNSQRAACVCEGEERDEL
ncbi:group XIIB secretory phospholipase A2-like protein isoform X2 [Notolabrus celidotus]|uniref:group XIIB secretory phospholipase A2-like protein isoform X2 n=1 Tax=Notolabrus celidotus TaxID=1203425 RepID=UPI00148F5CA5|nr:group XIIB secretory phospholipase A2-like protein isoform X2 [Notolabrus celidotus]